MTALWGLGLLSPRFNFADSKSGTVNWIAPANYHMGDAVIVPARPNVTAVWLGGRPMTYLPKRKVWLGVAPHGNAGIVFHMGKRRMAERVIPVISPPVKTATDLRLPAEVWDKVMVGQDEERAKNRTILGKVMNDFKGKFKTSCWKPPIKSSITSNFGSPRRLQNGQVYHHGGEDRRAGIGTPVKAMGDGRVAFAGDMVLPGLNVVLNHGDGWFSRYLHLSKLKVKTGNEVKTGHLIGLSGASGRVQAPHLHWEILWRGIPANPARFLPEWERLCDRG